MFRAGLGFRVSLNLTQGFLSSSFLGLLRFLVRGYNMLHKKVFSLGFRCIPLKKNYIGGAG